MDHQLEKSRELNVEIESRTGCYRITNGLKLRRIANGSKLLSGRELCVLISGRERADYQAEYRVANGIGSRTGYVLRSSIRIELGQSEVASCETDREREQTEYRC